MSALKSLVSIGAVALALASGGAVAADMENAKKKVTEICQACHGMDGNSPIAENPKLAGQHPDYLAKALRDYKSGARKNPVMGAMASTLTAKDIGDLAEYYGSQPAVLISRH